MSHDLYTWGSIDPIYFKLTLNGAGVVPTIALGDIQWSKDSGGFTDIPLSELAAVGTTGVHKWTPGAAADTQAEILIINIKDVSGGGFDENCLIIATGGDAAARFSG